MLKVMMLRKRVELLQNEAGQLRAAEAGYAKREADIAAQVAAAGTEAEVAAAAAAVKELEKQQKTTKERLEAIKEEVDALLKEIEDTDAAAAAAASGGGDGGEESRARRGITAPWAQRGVGDWERRCGEFKRTGHMLYSGAKSLLTRAALLSSGTIGPTGVDGIHEPAGSGPSSFIDMVTITDCTGMSTYKVAYQIDDVEAAAGTEGKVPAESEPTFGFVELKPALYDVISYISKYVMRYTPLKYEDVIRKSIHKALRTVVSKLAVQKLLASDMNDTYAVTAASGSELFTPTLLSDLILAYGGDESVEGGAVLLMNKADLKGFASVRGKNEYLPVYSYTPDPGSPSTGIIKDNNGLATRYCLNKNVPALYGAALSGTAIKGMAYGDPKNLEIALWGGMEVDVSKDYKFGEGLISLRGDVTADAAVNTKHGFVVVSATKSAG